MHWSFTHAAKELDLQVRFAVMKKGAEQLVVELV